MTIADLAPINLNSEILKFQTNTDYNPFFEYTHIIDPSFLTRWGMPKEEFLSLSEKIIDLYHSSEKIPPSTEYLSENQIMNHVNEYFKRKKIVTSTVVRFHEPQIARCYVSDKVISFRKNLKVNQKEYEALFRHEIETHFLRRYNHAQNGHTPYKPTDKGRTEEGLAILHTTLFEPTPVLYKSAVRYIATSLSASLGFSELYHTLLTKKISPDQALRATLRAKRGLRETRKPGGNTKDIIYLEGTIKMVKWLLNPENDSRLLYTTRVIPEEWEVVPKLTENLVLPDFYNDLTLYIKEIKKIAQVNFLL